MGLKQLRWNPKSGVSGTAKLVADYDDDDTYHKGSMVALIALIAEIWALSVVENYQITREQLLQLYDEAMEKKVYVP